MLKQFLVIRAGTVAEQLLWDYVIKSGMDESDDKKDK